MKTNHYFSNKKCSICGDIVSGVNYGVLTCESCKIFFFRNQDKKFTCIKGSQCTIDVHTRKKCSNCRMKKCLTAGMVKTFNCKNDSKMEINCGLKSIILSDQKLPEKRYENQRKISKPNSLAMSQYERAQIAQVQHAVSSAFEDESKLEIIREVNNFTAIGQLQFPDVYARKIVKFAKCFPALTQLNKDDQLIILRNCVMEILLIRCAYSIDLLKNGYPIVENEAAKHAIFVQFKASKPRDKYLLYLHSEFDNDFVIRDLIMAQTLFRSHSNVSCPEFIRYQHVMYNKLLRRYLTSKYGKQPVAERKFVQLINMMNYMDTFKQRLLRKCQEANVELPEIMLEVIESLSSSQ